MISITYELTWLRQLLRDLHIDHPQPVTLFCDNQIVMHIAANSLFYERTKQIEIVCHIVRERIDREEIKIVYVATKY